MKNLILNDFGVQEMNAEEMRETDGGKFWGPLFLGAFVAELIFDGPKQCWEDFKAGFNSVSSVN